MKRITTVTLAAVASFHAARFTPETSSFTIWLGELYRKNFLARGKIEQNLPAIALHVCEVPAVAEGEKLPKAAYYMELLGGENATEVAMAQVKQLLEKQPMIISTGPLNTVRSSNLFFVHDPDAVTWVIRCTQRKGRWEISAFKPTVYVPQVGDRIFSPALLPGE